ncbi:MAG: hypothetical protein ABSB74_07385 [Tepidisphaeraceae bacterium]
MRRVVLQALSALMVMLVGCDKRPQSEASNTQDTSGGAADAPAQQVASSPQVNVPMKIMPLTLTLPAGWKLDPPMNPTFLEGPMPSGDVEISLSLMDSMVDRNRQLFITGAIDESQKHPDRIHVRQLTTKTGLAMLERITYLTSPDDPATRPAATLPSQQLSWNLIVFVPYHQQKFIPCSFDLLGLTQQQYDEDQQLVRSMIDTAQPVKTLAFQ